MKHHTKTRSIPNIISMAEVNNDQESQTARIKANISEDIASLFTRYLASVFESDDALNDTSNELEALVLSEIILTVEEVQAVLETLLQCRCARYSISPYKTRCSPRKLPI